MSKKSNDNPKFLDFHHRKLPRKAKEYRHELFHVTRDLMEINRRIQQQLCICTFCINVLGQPSKGYRIDYNDAFDAIHDLRFEIENFIFRVQAYRDKLCLFVNFALNVGYTEDERQLLNHLIDHHIVKESLISTELIKLKETPFREIMAKRKAMTHKSYYKVGLFSQYFMPSDESLSPRKIGVKKASVEWRRNIKKEPEALEECLVKIFELNEKITKKVKDYLNKS